MSGRDPLVDTWIREILKADGKLPLARLVERLVPVGELRDLARQHEVVLKGYRIERASAKQLAPKLADPKRAELVEEVCERILARIGECERLGSEGPDCSAEVERKQRALDLRTKELQQARDEVARLRAGAARQREREERLVHDLDAERERAALLRAEIETLQLRLDRKRSADGGARAAAAVEHRLHDLERELASAAVAEEGLRRLVAVRQQRVRELEEHVAELRALVPNKKVKPQVRPAEPELAAQFRVPHLSPQFYKSLEGKERRSVERGVQAVLLFCTEGPAYPGLEVKQIEGQDLWSLRASLKLRVYFRFRHDGDIEVLALADREDQHTMLRRLKER